MIWDLVKEKGRLLIDIKGSYHFGDSIKIPFETDKISKKTLEQCMYLVENQEWVSGENDISNIKKCFEARVGRDVQKAAVVGNGANSLGRYLEIEWEHVHVLKMQQASIPDEISSKYVLESDHEGNYFNSLFRLMQDEEYQIILDMSKKRLLRQKVKKTEIELVRNELLPLPSEWDSAPKKYLACRLKNNSPDICSAKNGIVYKDNIALPFSPSLQGENISCGKIESGLAFISLAAFNLNSRYTADYMIVKKEAGLQELIIADDKGSALEMIISELDILFYPEISEYSFSLFSRAKMNAVYYSVKCETGAVAYRVLDISAPRSDHQKIKRDLSKRRAIGDRMEEFFVLAGKASKVLILWVQILSFKVFIAVKNLISGIMKT